MPGTIVSSSGRVFEVTKTLGSGASCKAKLGIDTETQRQVAIKIINKNMDQNTAKLVETEVKAMAKFKHENVLEMIDYDKGLYKKEGKPDREITYIVLELAEGGEVFDYVANSGRFEERVARYFFKQFLEGLDHVHMNGHSHRDLKPENLLLDKDFVLKIADFGFAAPIEGRDGLDGNLMTKLGTLNYMSPEQHLKQPYQGRCVDLFAAATILFILVTGHPPFTEAKPSDPFYKCMAASRADIFWKTHSKSKDEGEKFFSEGFKQIISGCMQLDVNHRPTISEVLAHPWMKGDTATREEIIQEFKVREIKVKKAIEEDKAAKAIEKARQNQQFRAFRTMRSAGVKDDEEKKFDLNDEELMKPDKKLEKHVKTFNQMTEFYSTYSPDQIEEKVKNYLTGEKIEPKINGSKYKMKFTNTNTTQEGVVQTVDVQMQLLQCDNNTIAVEFSNRGGDKQRFNEVYQVMKKDILNDMNDTVLA